MDTIIILSKIFNFLLTFIYFYSIGMVIYFFMSWIPGLQQSAVGRFLGRIYEPFLEPFRRIIPPIGMIDISSIAALIFLRFLSIGLEAIFRMILNQMI